ncbi:uncharacterized protein V6R79_010993 [Siganus canaliculatus]
MASRWEALKPKGQRYCDRISDQARPKPPQPTIQPVQRPQTFDATDLNPTNWPSLPSNVVSDKSPVKREPCQSKLTGSTGSSPDDQPVPTMNGSADKEGSTESSPDDQPAPTEEGSADSKSIISSSLDDLPAIADCSAICDDEVEQLRDQLQMEIQKNSDLQMKADKYLKVKDFYNNLKDAHVALKAKLQTEMDKNSDLQQQLNRCEDSYYRLKAENLKLKDEHEVMSDEMHSHSSNKHLQEEHEKLQDAFSELQDNYKKLQATCEAEKRHFSQHLKAEITDTQHWKDKCDGYYKMIRKVEAEKKRLQESQGHEKETLHKDLQMEKSKNSHLQQDLSKLRESFRQSEAARVAEKQHINNVVQVNLDLKKRLEQLKDTFKLLEAENKKLKDGHAAEKLQWDLQLEISAKKTVDSLNSTIKRLEAENQTFCNLRAEHNKLQDAHAALKKISDEKVQTEIKRNWELRGTLDQVKTSFSKLQCENTDIRLSHLAQKEKFTRDLKLEIDKNGELQEHLDQLKESFKELEGDHIKLQLQHATEEERFKQDLQLEVDKNQALLEEVAQLRECAEELARVHSEQRAPKKKPSFFKRLQHFLGLTSQERSTE